MLDLSVCLSVCRSMEDWICMNGMKSGSLLAIGPGACYSPYYPDDEKKGDRTKGASVSCS